MESLAISALIQNLSSLFVFHNDLQIFDLSFIHVNRDIPGSCVTLHYDEPAPLIVGQAHEISFPIDLKIHLILPNT